jgi:thioredoxin 1
MANVVDVTDDMFQEKVINAGRPVLVDFTAPWCGPCKSMAPAVLDMANEYAGSVDVYTIQIDDNPVTVGRFGVVSVPTFILFNGEEVLTKMVGTTSRSRLASALDQALKDKS